VLSSFTNIHWPEVSAAYGKFTKTSTEFPLYIEALDKEETLYPTNKVLMGRIMNKCHRVVSVYDALLGTQGRSATHISDVPTAERYEIGLRLLYVHLGHLAYLAFTPKKTQSGYKAGDHKLIEDMLEGYLTPQVNGSIRCDHADRISLQFKLDLYALSVMYMEFKCMQSPFNMPTWSDLQSVYMDSTMILSQPPIASEVPGRSFLLNPFFRTMAPNAVPGSLDSAAWSALNQNWRVTILMLLVRTCS
jgi:hypothetical protein